MWEFKTVRDLTIGELTKPNVLDDISKILLSIKYGVPHWFLSGCEQLVTRDKGPRDTEARLLGEEISTKIWDLRERRIKVVHGITREYPSFNLEATINAIFNECSDS